MLNLKIHAHYFTIVNGIKTLVTIYNITLKVIQFFEENNNEQSYQIALLVSSTWHTGENFDRKFGITLCVKKHQSSWYVVNYLYLTVSDDYWTWIIDRNEELLNVNLQCKPQVKLELSSISENLYCVCILIIDKAY